MKAHLRVRHLAGRALRILTLRPGTDVAFSTNQFHRTWHIVSSFEGGRLLAHLLWGLSFQRHTGTLFLIHGPHLAPTPFDADPSRPIALVPSHLTGASEGLFRELRRALGGLGPPDCSVRWKSHGLTLAREARGHARADRTERVRMLGGFVVLEAGPAALRAIADDVLSMRTGGEGRSDFRYLAERDARRRWHPDGEVQLFDEYPRMCSLALEARARVLARRDEGPPYDGDPTHELRARVWNETEAVLAKRRWSPLT